MPPNLATSGGSFPELQPFGCMQTHSYLSPLQKRASSHPDIRQRKQRDELRGVFLQSPTAHLAMTELAFDYPKRVFHFGAHTGLEFFSLLGERAPGRMLLRFTFTRAHGYLPCHTGGFFSLVGTLVTCVAEDNLFLTVQQAMTLRDNVDIGSRSDDGVHQARICVDSDMRFHPKVPLVALLGLVHLGVTLTGTALGGAGRCNQNGIDYAASFEQQALGGQLGVDHLQDLRAQVVFFEQMTKTQDADSVRNSLSAADAYEVTVEVGLVRCSFGPQVRQTNPLLQAISAQHHCQIKRRTSYLGHRCMRRDQCQQLTPRHDLLHLIEQDLLARAPHVEIEAKVFLFHAVNARNLRAPNPTGWGRALNMIPNRFSVSAKPN